MNNTGKDISFVIQGAVMSDEKNNKNWTRLSCESIRTLFSDAEIILSTWKGSDVSGIDYDILIENEDPGALTSYFREKNGESCINNINRQIVSSREGIKRAGRKYVMKLRSDSYLTGKEFLDFYSLYGREDIGRKTRILSFEPRNPKGLYSGQFCLCDFWFFGTKEDLLRLWDIPLYKNSEIKADLIGEEYLCHRWLANKFGAGPYDEDMYFNMLKNDFVVIPARKSGIRSGKYEKLNDFITVCIKHYMTSHSEWRCLSNQYSFRQYLSAKLQFYSGSLFLKIRYLYFWGKTGRKKYKADSL